MTKLNSIGTMMGVAVAVILMWLIYDNERKRRTIAEMKQVIDESEDLTIELKLRLKDLISNNKDIEPQIARELSQIAELIEIKQDTTAVQKLAKIIENLLKELYDKDEEVKNIAKANGRKTPVFADYLQHAKNKQLILAEDFHLLSVMKIIRNQEAHELGVKKEKSRILASFISGIGMVLMLCRILKKKSLESKI